MARGPNNQDEVYIANAPNDAPGPCPFCALPEERIIDRSPLALAVRDGYPVSLGHTLIVPRRHVGSFFDATEEERGDLLTLLDRAKRQFASELRPDGFAIGINDGAAAGQTVPHLHIHLIPRYLGDQSDPRGGVRWVLPENARYWKE